MRGLATHVGARIPHGGSVIDALFLFRWNGDLTDTMGNFVDNVTAEPFTSSNPPYIGAQSVDFQPQGGAQSWVNVQTALLDIGPTEKFCFEGFVRCYGPAAFIGRPRWIFRTADDINRDEYGFTMGFNGNPLDSLTVGVTIPDTISTSTALGGGIGLAYDTWLHFSFMRNDLGVHRLHGNGIHLSSLTLAYVRPSSTKIIDGGNQTGVDGFYGQFSDLRLVVGSTVYPCDGSNYTPPASPLATFAPVI